MKKVFYWSPYLSNVATIRNVINSAYSLTKYNKNSFNDINFGENVLKTALLIEESSIKKKELSNK